MTGIQLDDGVWVDAGDVAAETLRKIVAKDGSVRRGSIAAKVTQMLGYKFPHRALVCALATREDFLRSLPGLRYDTYSETLVPSAPVWPPGQAEGRG